MALMQKMVYAVSEDTMTTMMSFVKYHRNVFLRILTHIGIIYIMIRSNVFEQNIILKTIRIIVFNR